MDSHIIQNKSSKPFHIKASTKPKKFINRKKLKYYNLSFPTVGGKRNRRLLELIPFLSFETNQQGWNKISYLSGLEITFYDNLSWNAIVHKQIEKHNIILKQKQLVDQSMYVHDVPNKYIYVYNS